MNYVYEQSALLGTPLPRVLYAMKLVPGAKFGSLEEQICIMANRFLLEGGLFLPLFIDDAVAPDLEQYTSRGIQAECLDLFPFSVTKLRRLIHLINQHRIEIVHWNFVHPVRNPYLWSLSVFCPQVRHWFTDHISRPRKYSPSVGGPFGPVKRMLMSRYDKIICVSEFVWRANRNAAPRSHLVVQPGFVNTARFAPDAAAREQMRETEGVRDKFVTLFVGQLIPDKGLEVALRAIAQLPDHVCLWIVGSGPDEPRLMGLVNDLGIQNRIRFFGSRMNVERFMQAADILVCPSLWAEAAGLVNIEAQATALPVIASRIGGIPEYIIDGETGVLVAPGNVDDLSRQLDNMLHDPDLVLRLGKAARAWAIEAFSEDRASEALDAYRHHQRE